MNHSEEFSKVVVKLLYHGLCWIHPVQDDEESKIGHSIGSQAFLPDMSLQQIE